jgi:hypothetical protein
MIELESANHLSFKFCRGVSWGHVSGFVSSASQLNLGPLSPMIAAYGGSQCLGGIVLLACESDDPCTGFVSPLAICF